jgi:hypothetical protein
MVQNIVIDYSLTLSLYAVDSEGGYNQIGMKGIIGMYQVPSLLSQLFVSHHCHTAALLMNSFPTSFQN